MPLARVLIENYGNIAHCEFHPRESTAPGGENENYLVEERRAAGALPAALLRQAFSGNL